MREKENVESVPSRNETTNRSRYPRCRPPPVQPAGEETRERRGGEGHGTHRRVPSREIPAPGPCRHEVRRERGPGRRARAAHEHGDGPQREDHREGRCRAGGEQGNGRHGEDRETGDAPVRRDHEGLAGPEAAHCRGARGVRGDAEEVREADPGSDAVGRGAQGQGEQGNELLGEAAGCLAEERVDEQSAQAGQPAGQRGPAMRSSHAGKMRGGDSGGRCPQGVSRAGGRARRRPRPASPGRTGAGPGATRAGTLRGLRRRRRRRRARRLPARLRPA